MRYWRPAVTGRRALVVGFSRRTASFCTGYRVVARVATTGSDERGSELARCTLRGPLAGVWPQIVALSN